MSMTTELAQRMKAAALNATGAHERLSVMPEGDIFDISLAEGNQLDADITALNSFHDEATPANVLALVEALEAAERRSAEYEGMVFVPVEPTLDQLVAGKRRLTSTGRMSRLMSQRLADVYRAMVGVAVEGE